MCVCVCVCVCVCACVCACVCVFVCEGGCVVFMEIILPLHRRSKSGCPCTSYCYCLKT